jgi:hypothetical protein
MSAFAAVSGLRRYLRDHPDTSPEQAALSLRNSDADYAAADFDGGIRLHEQLPQEIDFVDPRTGIRDGLTVLIHRHLPMWSKFFPYGRQRLAVALTQDELQTFKSAGLFEEHPSPSIVEWWDTLAAKMRALTDEKLNSQGREGELLSLEYERNRLAALGITDQPRWTAIEDNGAGYDIQSYDQTPYGLKNRLIEVKSTKRNPPRMILSRGEWDAAVKYGDAYFVHLWRLPAQELTVLSGSEIQKHIPDDCGGGRWTEIEIKF